ncbi:dihydropteroate synthase [Thiohalocapsa marina]|uniref:Dihydropteroate synthase n=1 Tax=Thiohalocapsa marina TaxID=424902 RepID=A0A5M8FQS2_9GAMM|nr:dihydropteroate synthase [Thiohalocapsa marina]KAA6186236.1 dihydropteroate synthase [Thiohalocapsa marina]
MRLDCGGRSLDLTVPRVMGILNVTPDSFSDGGRFFAPDKALRQVEQMLRDGADLIDIGGESTRPGSEPVSAEEECRRVVPMVSAIVARFDVPVSVDTSKPAVMRAAADAGAGLINDVCALREPGALAAAAQTGLPVCLMHMQGRPRDMQQQPRYDDVLAEVHAFLAQRLQACEAVGIPRDRLIVDPGFGFGKSLSHNLALLAGLESFSAFGVPILAGLSRKSMLGAITGREVGDRVAASVAAALLAAQRGAQILRVHDVGPTVDALRVWAAVSAV